MWGTADPPGPVAEELRLGDGSLLLCTTQLRERSGQMNIRQCVDYKADPLLKLASQGERDALDQVFGVLYPKLRKISRASAVARPVDKHGDDRADARELPTVCRFDRIGAERSQTLFRVYGEDDA